MPSVDRDFFFPGFGEADVYPDGRAVGHDKVNLPFSWCSPSFLPFGLAYITPSSSSVYAQRLVDLISATHRWLQTFKTRAVSTASDNDLVDRAQQRLLLERAAPYDELHVHESGYMYGCCRLTARLLLAAERKGSRLPELAEVSGYRSKIEYALHRTDLYKSWGDSVGLQCWVFVVRAAAVAADHFFQNTDPVVIMLMVSRMARDKSHVGVLLRPLERVLESQNMCEMKGPSGSDELDAGHIDQAMIDIT